MCIPNHCTTIKIRILILIHYHHVNLTYHQISPNVPKISFINKWPSLRTMHCHLPVMFLYLFQSELGPRIFLIFMMLTLTKTLGQLFSISVWVSLLVYIIQFSYATLAVISKLYSIYTYIMK